MDKLLGFSRLGRAELQRTPIDMTALFGEVRKEVMAEAEGRALTWIVGDWPAVVGDLLMIRMAVRDFLSNAVKYTRGKEPAVLPLALDRVSDRRGFEARLAAARYDLILGDYQIPGFDGLAALELARAHQPEVPFMFVSGMMGEELAIETLKRGATDYILKQRLARLPAAIERALSEARDAPSGRGPMRSARNSCRSPTRAPSSSPSATCASSSTATPSA